VVFCFVFVFVFFRVGVLVKQLRSRRKEMGVEREREQDGVGEAGRTRSVMAPNVRKNATHKDNSQEKSHVHRAKFNGRPKLPGWPGKR
jgi:hypothetical protein